MQLGIDLGGTKIEVAVLSTAGELIFRERRPTPADNYPAILGAIADLVATAEAAVQETCTVGIGTPGSLSRVTGLMKNSNSVCLNDRPLQRDLEQRLGREVRIANDANCLVLSEAIDGVAAGLPVVFGVILGTGVGSGLVVDQRLIAAGANAIGSEWGHNRLPGLGVEFEDEQRRCYCGRANCIETYLSGRGLAATFRHLGGPPHSGEQVARDATAGDTLAEQAVAHYCRQLALALSQVINLIDPDAIVVGGGVSNLDAIYAQVPALWRDDIFSDECATPLLKARFGDSSGVRGAARLWPLADAR